MRFWLGLMICLLSANLCAQTLELKVNGDRSLSGTLHIAVYDDPQEFPGGQASLRAERSWPSMANPVRLDGLATGRYAVTIYLDTNGNGKLDRNFIGLPGEPVGLSGDPGFGPPQFEDSVFELSAPTTQLEIRLE
ncbi:DUF2141 domain-containing protein [Marinobacteraceae bacterium S3BR75-40.1]